MGSGARPSLSPESVADLLREQYGLEGELAPLPAELDQNLRLETAAGEKFVVKIAGHGTDAAVLDLQHRALERLAGCRIASVVPRVVRTLDGREVVGVEGSGEETAPHLLRVLTWLEGTPWSAVRPTDSRTLVRLGETLAEVDRRLADLRHPAMGREHAWDLASAGWISPHLRRIPDPRRRAIVERLFLQHRARVEPLLPHLPAGVVHNDANDENVLLSPHPEGGWQVAGLLDFGDMVHTATVNELAIACAYVGLHADDPLQVAEAVVAGYHHVRPLCEQELHVLFPLLCLRLCVSVTASAIAAQEDPDNAHRQLSDRAAWEALERLRRVDRAEAEDRFRAACGLAPAPRPDPEPWDADRLLARRRALLAPSLSLSYREPLVVARGQGQFLFDPAGRAYLDCVNNVPHVGHSHPRVVEAIARQAAVLATNTRYLHPLVLDYAERLVATLPAPLRVCFFVNSGSEANELAVRIAHTVTGRRDAIVLEGAYHGNTATLVDLSPYKCEGPGGRGLPPWVHRAPKPDPYRGPHRGSGPAVGAAYAGALGALCDRLVSEGRPPAFLMVEPILGCGGQVVLPEGYLAEAFARVRGAGGLCLVDEVQVGMGRVGTHWWAFETQGVVPDIVTMGKPLGNGHPLGAVVTTPEIASAFANGMEYFSTFGGNPVSMAAGLAVREVMEEEGLRERALRVGRYLADGFGALGETHPQIGDVRGLGMFLGVELVRDRATREPATDETAALIERVKADGILLSAEGPFHNVLKIKPPLAFEEADADALLGAVERALPEVVRRT